MPAKTVKKERAIFASSTVDATGAKQAYSQRLVNCRAEYSNQGPLEGESSLNTNYYIKGTEGIKTASAVNDAIENHNILAIEPVWFYNYPGEYLAIFTTGGLFLWSDKRIQNVGLIDEISLTDDHPTESNKAYMACNGFTIVITIPRTGKGYIYVPDDIAAVTGSANVGDVPERTFPAINKDRNPHFEGRNKDLTDLRECFEGSEDVSGLQFNTVTFVNGRYLLTLKNSPQFRWSGVFDSPETGNRFPANWVATSEASPDPTLNILFDGQTLVMAGRQAVETWQNNADEDPTLAFTRLPGGIINRSFIGADACCRIGNAIYGLQDDGTIWQISGTRISPVTTTTQAQILSTPADETREGCGIVYGNLFTYRSNGNDFLIAQTRMISRPIGGTGVATLGVSHTLILDLSTGLYHIRTDGENDPWSIVYATEFRGNTFGIREKNKKRYLVEINDCYNDDEGDPIFRIATTNPIQWKNQRVTQYEFELYTGFDIHDSNLIVNYRDSTDGGNTWIDYIPFQGGQDEYEDQDAGRIVWRSDMTGELFRQARNRIIQISYTGKENFIVYNAYVTDKADNPGGG